MEGGIKVEALRLWGVQVNNTWSNEVMFYISDYTIAITDPHTNLVLHINFDHWDAVRNFIDEKIKEVRLKDAQADS